MPWAADFEKSRVVGGLARRAPSQAYRQEFLREANTTASKCQDAATAHLVVELKAEIERLREQAQNVE